MKKNLRTTTRHHLLAFLLIFLFQATSLIAQNVVSGTITSSDDGLPIPGVNIIVKGTTRGAVSDFNGEYTINVSENETLVFRYLGYVTTENVVGNQSTINISLQPDNQQLDEVVVVGYGTQQKASLTGSVSAISTENIESRPVTNISSGLAGLAPGVLITQSNGGVAGGDAAVIRIRGVGTFGDSNPLVVVDGVPSGNASIINDLDPNDIKNISILKDASAAIYGSRGANGVVLVTTKKGVSGKPTFEYNAYTGFQKVLRNPEFVGDFATYMELANINRGTEIFNVDDIQEWRDNPNDPLLYPNVEWYKEQIDNTAFIQSHNLSFSGGTDITTYRFSLSYLDQNGIILGNELERYGARLNLQSEVLKGLKVGGNLFFRWSDLDARGNQITMGMVPGIPNVRHPDGRWGGQQQDAVGTIDNPYAQYANTSDKRRQQRFQGDIFASLEILKGLKATAQFALNFNNEHRNRFTGRYDLWNFRSDMITRQLGLQSNRVFNSRGDEDYLLNSNFLLEYKKDIGNHSFNVLGGYESLQFQSDFVQAEINNIPSDDLQSINAGLENPSVSGNTQRWGLISYFGKLNYAFANKYLLEGTIRADGSSRFRDGKKWGYFPAVSVGWVVSKESFMDNIDFIDFLKFRGSWGELGNNRIGIYPYQEVYNLNQNYSFGGTVYSGIAQNSLVDKDIQWERTTNKNIGIDARFFNNTLDLTFDYYERTTDDILTSLPVPDFLGDKSNPTVNLAQMINKGFEISLGFKGKIGELSYYINGNFTQNDNEVTDYFADIQSGGTQIGLPFNSFWGLEVVDVFRTQEQLDNAAFHANGTELGDLEFKDQLTIDTDGDGIFDQADGEINNNDRVFIGSRIPKYIYGGGLGFKFKGFDFSMLFQGIGKRSVNTLGSGTIPIQNSDRGLIHQKWADEAWSPTNVDGTLPRLNESAFSGLNNDLSSFWVRDVSFMRVKNMQLGYRLKNNVTENLGIQKLRVYVSADNLITWTNEDWGFDPETADYGGEVPNVATFIVGLQLGF